MSLTSRGNLRVVVHEMMEVGQPPLNGKHGAVSATVSLCNSKGVCVASFSTAVFPQPAQRGGIKSVPSVGSVVVGEHFFFNNVLYEGSTVEISVNAVGAETKVAAIGSTSIPVSRLEENVSIEQWYSLPPSLRAAVKLSLLYEKERVITRSSSSGGRYTALQSTPAPGSGESEMPWSAAGSSYAVTQELSRRLSVCEPASPAPGSPRDFGPSAACSTPSVDSLASPLGQRKSGASSPSKALFGSMDPEENLRLAADQQMILDTLAKIDQLDGREEETKVERPKLSEIEPILVRKAELAKDKSPVIEAATENLPAGVIDYAIIFGPQSLSTRPRQRSASSSSTPVSSSRSSAPAALSPTSPGSTSSSLRAITESNVRQWDRFPAHDLVDSPLPGKIEWFACPEGCKWVQSVERPEPYTSSFVLTAGGLADDLFGVSLNFFVACVEQFDTSSPQDDLTSPDDQSPAAELPPWYDESTSSSSASGTQWVCTRLCVVSRWAFFEQLGQILLHLYSSSLLPLLVPWEYSMRLGQGDEQDGCLPLDLGAILTSLCFRCPVPVPGVYSVSLRLESAQERERARVIHLLLASPRDLPLCPYSLASFVSALGPRGCVNALSCALSECKMLFHSEDLSKLPPFCEALRALLYPLRWAHVYLPVVPAALLDLMEAPVPFILGTHTAWLKYIPSECLRDVVLVDCDSGAIDFGTADRLVFPVAEDRWLVSVLKMIIDPLEGRQDEALLTQSSSSRHTAVDAVLASAQIQAAVCDVLVSFLKRVPDCLFYLHASSPVFNRNLLLGTHGPSRRKFLEMLTDTNSFHTFTEELSSSPGLAFLRETLARLRQFEDGLNIGVSSPFSSLGGEASSDDVRAAPSSPIRRPAGELVSSPLASTKRRFFVDAEPEAASGGAADSGKHLGELSVPAWVSLGRSTTPGPRKLLEERLSLYVPHIQWLRETAQHAGVVGDGVGQETLVATGTAPLLAFSLALPLPAVGAKPRGQTPLPTPPMVQVGGVASPLSVNVGRRGSSVYSSMLLLDSRDALPPSIPSSKENGGLLKTLKAHKVCTLVEDPSIAVLGGMDKETFLAHFLDSSRSLSEERGLTQQLESSKDAVFGFLVEDRNVNSSLQAVLRFLQLVISGRGSQEEMQDSLGNCVNSLQIAANRLALISLLKEAKINSPHSSLPQTEQSPQQRSVYVFPLNASMFDALSRCFQAFLQICVAQNDFLSAYDLLEVGGLYYMPASIAAASEAAEVVDGHDDVFLSAHILQHPVYQSSLLWRGVLNNRLTSQPSAQQPQVRVVVSEAQNYLGIMAALGINFFRAMDFVQAVQSDWGLKLEEYLELARYTKKLWADVEQTPQQNGDAAQESDGSQPTEVVGADDLLHQHVQLQHTRSHSPSFSMPRRASDAGSDDADSLNLPGEDRDSFVGGRERATSSANDLSFVSSPFRSGSRQHASTIESRYVQLSLDPAFARESISSATCLGGDAFAVGCESGHVLLSSFSRKECLRVKHGPDPLVCVAAIRESSSSGTVPTAPWRANEGSSAFASVCSNSVVKLWLRSSLTKPPICAVTLKNHSHAVTCLSAAGYVDGRFLLASGDAGGDVRISLSPSYSSSSSSALSSLSLTSSSAAAWAQHSHPTAQSRDGSRATSVAVGAAITAISTAASAFVKDDSLALGTRGGAVELLDLGESLRPICRTQAHGARVNSIIFVRPKQFVTCSDDRGVSLWDVRVRSPVMFLPVEEHSSAGSGSDGSGLVETTFGGLQKAAQGPVTDITVGGHDNALIISAAADNSIKIWDYRFASISRPSCILRGHKGRVTSVSWDAASDHLQSCSVDGTVRTWDAVTGSNIDLTWTWAPCVHLSTAAFESDPGAPSKSAGILARTFSWRGGEVKAFLRLCD